MTIAEIRTKLNSLPPEFDDRQLVFVVDEYGDAEDSCGAEVARAVDGLRFRTVHNWIEAQVSYADQGHKRWLSGQLEDLPERK